MEIKRKVKESMSKAREWCYEHREGIENVGCVGIGVLAGIGCFLEGRAWERLSIEKRIGLEWGETDLVSYRDEDTGKVAGIVTKRLASAIMHPDEIIRYDDGSFDYVSDVQK